MFTAVSFTSVVQFLWSRNGGRPIFDHFWVISREYSRGKCSNLHRQSLCLQTWFGRRRIFLLCVQTDRWLHPLWAAIQAEAFTCHAVSRAFDNFSPFCYKIMNIWCLQISNERTWRYILTGAQIICTWKTKNRNLHRWWTETGGMSL